MLSTLVTGDGKAGGMLERRSLIGSQTRLWSRPRKRRQAHPPSFLCLASRHARVLVRMLSCIAFCRPVAVLACANFNFAEDVLDPG